MKIISHRGASAIKIENSLESLLYAGELGADMVECDVTKLADGMYVMYHDNTMKRLAGVDVPVSEITYPQMCEMLKRCGRSLMEFSYLLKNYNSNVPILLHIKMEELDEDFIEEIKTTKVPFVFGAITPRVVEQLHEFVPPERILSFAPHRHDYKVFHEKGAGNIRLWEHWLDEITPAEVKANCPGVEVWIMARDENKSNRGSIATLDKCKALGADGVLMDDPILGVSWKQRQGV